MTSEPPFDEELYLAEYPDVREAVAGGRFPSGLAHYLAHGRAENRRFPAAVDNPPEDRSLGPIPPRRLRLRVHGMNDLPSFLRVGKGVCDTIGDALQGRIELGPESRVLDFGCGCGRVLANFRAAYPGKLFGTDIDSEAIVWCQEHIPKIASFSRNAELPPLPFDEAGFDLVFSVSVFTHLPEGMQDAWLGELRRVLKPGGLALLSIHGPSLHPAAKAARAGFYYHDGPTTDGLPDFYKTAFHSHRYIRRHWGEFFDIEEILAKAVNGHQDLVVCRRRLADRRRSAVDRCRDWISTPWRRKRRAVPQERLEHSLLINE